MSMEASLQTGRARPVEVFRGPYECAGCRFAIRDAPMPIAEVRCHPDRPLLMAPSALLWRDPAVVLRPPPGAGRSGALPFGEAIGSGSLACGPSSPSGVFMLYLPPGRIIDLRRERLLCAAGVRWAPPEHDDPAALDRFVARDEGVVLLAGDGCAYEVALEQGECMQVAARALLYKDPSVTIATSSPNGFPGSLPCRGPGVLAIQLAAWAVA